MKEARLDVTICNILEIAPAAQARSISTAVGGREMTKQKRVDNSKFLERAIALRNRIKARTGAKFDVSALIRESRQGHRLKQ